MDRSFKWFFNNSARQIKASSTVNFLSFEEAEKSLQFHRKIPSYKSTPLVNLSQLAKATGVGAIYVKDESHRFGLNAFKALGASYAMDKYIAHNALRKQLGDITFATATDGNHGRGVAWAARQLGQKSVVYMPKGSSPIRLQNIKACGAEASITDLNYDDTVRLASENAAKFGWVSIQDTAWEGYDDIPRWIMQGYLTLIMETILQLKELGQDKPTHVFLQAGVGSFPAAIQGFLTSCYGESRPQTIIVESNMADCILQSAMAQDGKLRTTTGDMATIMAGLACGEPNPIAWEILRDFSDIFISCPDYVAAKGMRILGNPLGCDTRIVSGESGAVTTGLLYEILQNETLQQIKITLDLRPNSRILLISTEGDTDPDNYRRIVWNGDFPDLG